MSAFVCGSKHIGVLAQQISQKFPAENAGDVAEKMAKLNVESVDFRYGARHGYTSKKELKIFVSECRDEAAKVQDILPDARLWGAATCFLYQSCESAECEASETFKLVGQYQSYLKEQCAVQGIVEWVGWSI